MDIQERDIGSVVVLDVSGRIGIDDEGRVKDKINSLVLQGHRHLLLNLAAVSHIDSTGLGELVSSHVTLTTHGGHIKLANLTARVHDLMSICRLLTVFDVFDSEEDALRSFETVVGVKVQGRHARTSTAR
jgi:anti-sigma B factor antagonist